MHRLAWRSIPALFCWREQYPTRSVEVMLAWMMIVWSETLLEPSILLVGPTYQYLNVLAPESVWGAIGLAIGLMRVVALVRNGGWQRSPQLRLLGAAMGLIWWIILFSLYTAAVADGAPDFPMRRVYVVFMAFEAYSCFRCGQDHTAMKLKCEAEATPAGDAGHG